jgi:hypothetical protein
MIENFTTSDLMAIGLLDGLLEKEIEASSYTISFYQGCRKKDNVKYYVCKLNDIASIAE